MNPISSILRIVCGLTLVILSYSTYSKNSGNIAAGEPFQIFGYAIGASGTLLTVGFAVVGLIGLVLIVLGVVGLLKSRA